MKKMVLLALTAFLLLSVTQAQTTHVRAIKVTATDSITSGRPSAGAGFSTFGKWKGWLYKPVNVAANGPALNIDLRSTTGNVVEYLRLSNPLPQTYPGTHFSFYCSPTLNTGDTTYNNVVSFGFNPFGFQASNRAGIWRALEPWWNDNGQLNLEDHLQIRLLNGESVRLESNKFTVGATLATSGNNVYKSAEAYALQTVDSKQWYTSVTSRTNNTSIMSLITPNTGQGLNVTAQNTGVTLATGSYTGSNSAIQVSANIVNLPYASFTTIGGGIVLTGDLIGNNAIKATGFTWLTGNNGNFKRGYFSENPGAALHLWTGTATLGAVVKDNTNPTGLLFQLQKENFSTNILTVRNDGKIAAALPDYADDAAASADAALPANTFYRVGNSVRIK